MNQQYNLLLKNVPSILFITAYCRLMLEQGLIYIYILSFHFAVLERICISRTGKSIKGNSLNYLKRKE